MEDSPTISSRVSLTLDLPPSAIQFCTAHKEHFVVGTYNLEKGEATTETENENPDEETLTVATKPQSRNGSLLVFKVQNDQLTHLQTIPQPSALLDVRFSPLAGQEDILATVSSTGTLAVFRLDPIADGAAPLKHLATSRCEDLEEDVLFLQCNWHPEIPGVIAVTTSTGLARILHLTPEWQIDQWRDLELQNSLEAWCIALSPSTDYNGKVLNTVYCGGDDSILRYTTYAWEKQTTAEEHENLYGPVVIKGRHDAGVTAILPLPVFGKDGGRMVVTGSYDDHIRLFLIHDLDKSQGLKRVELVVDEDLGGGVWRLDLIDVQAVEGAKTRIRILASCMHAGARIVEMTCQRCDDGESWACRVLARFEEHQSMNYGCHFMPSGSEARLRCVSISFYDRRLCLWDYEQRADQDVQP